MNTLLKLLLLAATVATPASAATEPKVIPLWPGAPPGSESWKYEETETPRTNGGSRLLSNVTLPTLTAYLPEASVATGTGVVVCPGGGFRILVMDHEGVDAARWLNSIGVAAFVLKYRVMRTGDVDEKDPVMAERRKTVIPLSIADGQQAVRLVRAHAAEWGVASDRIGVMGFSAGGYVAASVAMHHDAESRPNFVAPIYPGTPEDVTAPADAPPMFLVHADDDKIVAPLEHSLRLYEAWKKVGAPAEMHIYMKGGHGFGTRKTGLPTEKWEDRFREWLEVQGLLKRK